MQRALYAAAHRAGISPWREGVGAPVPGLAEVVARLEPESALDLGCGVWSGCGPREAAPPGRPKRARQAPTRRGTLGRMHDENLRQLTAIPNVGPAIARRLVRLGITSPQNLRDQDPEDLFLRCSVLAGRPEDPCLLDTLRAAVDVANGEAPRPWWHYSRERIGRPRAAPSGGRGRARP